MLPRHPPKCQPKPTPHHWLMTDARLGADLLSAARNLPPNGTIILRPHAMTAAQLTPTILRQLRGIARARGHLLLHTNHIPAGFDGVHASGGRLRGRAKPISFPVHNPHDLAAARRAGARYVLISPIFASASHVGAAGMGMGRFKQLAQVARKAGMVAIALGGMDTARFCTMRRHGAKGWAAIGAWLRG